MARKEKASKPKKSIFKRWWFWLLIALILVGAFGSGSKNDSAPAPQATAEPSATHSVMPSKAPTEAPTAEPTEAPTAGPTAEQTEAPTTEPTEAPTPEPDISARVTELVDGNLAADGSEKVASVDLTDGKLSIVLSVPENGNAFLTGLDYAEDVVSRIGDKILDDEALDDLWSVIYVKVGENGPDCYLGKKSIVANEYALRYFDPEAIRESLEEAQ